ncbi:MAG: phosphogluconate dehydratase [Alteromonadaceae bacterium]|jgi:phosphogluconate dehydratase
MHPKITAITDRIIQRSKASRGRYLERIGQAGTASRARTSLPCGNLAHGFAACSDDEKTDLTAAQKANVAIVSAYNDMLSAHQPYQDYPQKLKAVIAAQGGVAQFAGGVPAMCDGITQGEAGMELSLFSRDVIAMSTAVALSHNMFDGVLYLGICDKIVPGLLIGALSFGHLPALFVPAGPMPSGLPNGEKARIRQLFSEGKCTREELLEAESASYHSAGTCTFYGTANSNQMLLEIMGLQLPGSSFVNPGTELREKLTEQAAKQVLKFTAAGDDYRPIGKVIDERTLVNGLVGLLATGGSTNQALHLVAIARAAGVILTMDDFSDLSEVVPLISQIYPNGMADINRFHAVGGTAFLIKTLLENGYLHQDVSTIADNSGLNDYTKEPKLTLELQGNVLNWRDAPSASLDSDVLRSANEPFSATGGLKAVKGNVGSAIVKTSAVKDDHRTIEAPARVFDSQLQFHAAFKAGELHRDFIAVIRFQGPKANGMPELHKLMTPLGALQDKGFKVAVITDGRMSGASGKVAAAIHLTPECTQGGLIGKIHDEDVIKLDTYTGDLQLLVSEEELKQRPMAVYSGENTAFGTGRELFSLFRNNVSDASAGACVLGSLADDIGQ